VELDDTFVPLPGSGAPVIKKVYVEPTEEDTERSLLKKQEIGVIVKKGKKKVMLSGGFK
jgi:hypothetical protein